MRTRIVGALIALLIALAYGRTLAAIVTPIFFALFFTLLLLPLVDRLDLSLKSRGLATAAVLLPTFALVGWALGGLAIRLYREAEGFVRNVPALIAQLEKLVSQHLLPLVEGTHYEDLMPIFIEEFLLGAIESLQVVALRLVGSGIWLLGTVPALFVSMMVMFLLTFYLIYEKRWVVGILPGAQANVDKVVTSINGFLRVQFFLITITAAISMVTFRVLGIPYVFVLGATIALFDLLPILGAGTLMIPMSIWYLVTGEPLKGIVLGVVYILIIAVRQVVEPRLLSANLGIHPIVAILCLFFGLQLFGVMGLVILPLVASVLASFPRFSWLRR